LLLQPLIDRERDVARACRLLRSGHRLVTLSGPAGVGKTQLSIRIANDLCAEFEHGACFVSLGEITDAAAVAGAIGRALGLKQTVPNTWDELLKAYAAQHHVLLVLDNFEHLLGAAPLVSGLIAAGDRLRVLCTSRAALNVAGETLVSVPPLQLPPTEPRPLGEIEHVASVALFVQRAQAAEPDFRLTDGNAAAIVALSRRLDGLPLAIELAAARVKLFGTDELQRRLEVSFDLLHRGRRDSPERHHSLEAVLRWGYQLLPLDAQRAFGWLGLFAGGVTLASARSVLADDTDDKDDGGGDAVADALELLLEHHLIALAEPERRDDDSGGSRVGRRYRMLQTVRAFALDQLRRDPDEPRARERFMRHWLALAERIAGERSAGRADEACATFEAEHGNFEAAVAWAAQHDATAAHRFVATLAPFWAMRGFGAEGRRWVQTIMPVPAAGSTTPDANASYAAGELLLNLGYYMEGMPHALAALKEARRGATPRRTVDSLRLVGHLHAMMGRWKQATSVFRQALQQSLTLGDASIAACRNSLGTLLRHQGEYAEAHDHFEQALAKVESVSPAMAAGILFNLSLLARLRGQYAEARDLCSQAVARARASHDLRKLGCVLVDHGELMLLTGSVEAGVAAIDEALAINKRVGDSFLEGCALQQKGAAAVLHGRACQARELLGRSLRVHRDACCGDQADITLLWLVRACWLDGSPDEAASYFAQLLQLGPKVRHYLLPSVLEEGAKLLHHRGQLPQAGLALAQSRAMRERFGLRPAPVEEKAALASRRALQTELGATRWHELSHAAQPVDADDPLRLLEDSLPRSVPVEDNA
ncbi:MAG TPA: tetratricopeptide repeat protein, partial [Burkholderiaceae bacterium]|nr:tetratricopeptide repeat protein [Burkholderiaceae bacterium]